MPHRPIVFLGALVAAAVVAAPALASHAWGNYHWARTANPFTVPLGHNMSSDWDDNLAAASADWTASSVLDAPVVAGSSKGRQCKASNGTVQVCNARYGFNGWLGLAQIWTSGSHIVKAVAKMNDSYLSSGSYSETNRQHVICQEIGHGFGLHHQDESGADLNTCMDYSNALDNPSPNAHDYQQLETIYNSHLDSSSTVGFTAGESGRVIHRRDTIATSYIVEDLGDGFLLHTFVSWAISRPGR